ncbi:MAG: hypothetical protein QNI92_01995 [Desulfobacterales bacterium]|nr:hypothetical protein [Desulfobacterales bacterium]
MHIAATLDQMFSDFIAGNIPLDLIKDLKDKVEPADVNLLMQKIDSLKDPSEYCKNDFDDQTVKGFFLFIDAVSALIINLGEPALPQMGDHSGSSHPFVPWVVKYVQDDRFHTEILQKFDGIFAG